MTECLFPHLTQTPVSPVKSEALTAPELTAEEPGDVCVERRDLSSCGLLYPALMKQSQPLTRSAIIEQEERTEEASEVVETFQGEERSAVSCSELVLQESWSTCRTAV